jgi:drug/metabolite transporter (DMT)-like permease
MSTRAANETPGSPRPAVVAAIAITVVLWGSAFVAIRAAAPEVGSQSLVSARLLLGASVFALLAKPLGIRRPRLAQLPLIGSISATGLVGYLLLLSAGESRVPAGVSAMIFATAPVLVLLLARVTLGERLHRSRWVGMAIALAGAGTVSAAQGLGDGGSLVGALLVLAAVCCYAPWVILGKRAARTMRPQDVAAWSTWLAATATLPLGIGVPSAFAHANASIIFSVLFLGVVVTTVPLVLWTWVLGRVSASVASSSLLLIGPSAVAISWIVLGETPAAAALGGGAVTLTGVSVTQLRPAKSRHRSDACHRDAWRVFTRASRSYRRSRALRPDASSLRRSPQVPPLAGSPSATRGNRGERRDRPAARDPGSPSRPVSSPPWVISEAPSGSRGTSAGMPRTTQEVKPSTSGASGSCTTTANALVPFGTPSTQAPATRPRLARMPLSNPVVTVERRRGDT